MPTIKLSCVILGWNDLPLIKKSCKILKKELKDIPYEIIVVDNGSTDGTDIWLKIRKDIVGVILPENTGHGHGMNVGFDKSIGEYIFFMNGDTLPTKGSVIGLLDYIEKHPDISYLGVNLWVSQGNEEQPEFNGFENQMLLGLGNYAYAYAVITREVIDSGARYLDDGIFMGAGSNYSDIDFAYQMYARGMKAHLFNAPFYYHKHNPTKFIDSGDQYAKTIERKKFLVTRWNKLSYLATHHNQPEERHLRRVAVMNNIHIGPATWFAESLRDFGCEVDQYNSMDVPEKKYDDYVFVDDCDWHHFDCPEWAHPSKYWALDFYYPHSWPYGNPNEYVRKGKTFDEFFVATKGAQEYAIQNGLNARYLPFAGSEKMHRFRPESEVIWDWVALWHNCGLRIDYSTAALERFPDGWYGWKEGDEYSEYMCHARCVINLCRINNYNQRVLETMFTKVPLVTDRVQDIGMYFTENEHYRGHSSIEEMLEQIQWVKDHPEEAKEMTERAYAVVSKGHTYYRRAIQMFAEEQ